MRATMREELLNLPNMLTMARVAAIPVVMLLIWNGDPENCIYASWLYALATATDFLDGWLARRRGLVTVLGKFLDPLADKLLVMAMLVILVALHRVPGWLVVVLLAREMTINGLRAIASTEGLVIPADQDGKIKTAFQMFAVMCLLIHYPAPVRLLWFYEVQVNWNEVGFWVLLLSLFFSLKSAIIYFRRFFAAVDEKRSAEVP
ncbi:MAG: CDP-diacylglycerol--glycerol-3-phosphate 3-phosphatidyltransferase [Myxococcales bacterium]|nr:CDP-diacylglycerol--glycerol-3-phosphate 3-phosphatidyltransferase [Myxococcales bacterium]